MNFSEHIIRSPISIKPEPRENTNLALELLESFKKHSDRTLLVSHESGRHYSGGDLLERTGRIALDLREQLDLMPGQVLLTICHHSESEVLLALGAILAGAGIFGTSANDSLEDGLEYCQMVMPDVIAVESGDHKRIEYLIQAMPELKRVRILWIDNPMGENSANSSVNNMPQVADGNSMLSMENNNQEAAPNLELRHIMERDRVFILDQLVQTQKISTPDLLNRLESISRQEINAREHILIYMMTSGSTGKPKVVPSTHEEVVWAQYGLLAASLWAQDPKQIQISPDSVISGDLPLDHGAGVTLMFLSLLVGAKLIVMQAYDTDTFWEAVDRHRISTSVASATFAYRLLSRLKELIDRKDPRISRWDLTCLRSISCAGMKVQFHALIREVNKYYPEMLIGQAYGCTEVGYLAIADADVCRQQPDSVGHLIPGVEALVVDPTSGQVIESSDENRGELLVRARSMFRAYMCLKGDDAHARTLACHAPGGFYKTGDQAHFDAAGRLYIHGRYKDTLFLDEDWKVMPAELESVVEAHPLVAVAAVVGLPDPDLPGCHAPRAYVTLVSAESEKFKSADKWAQLAYRRKQLDELARDIEQFVAARTAKAKHLKGGVRILDDFPRNGLLRKIDRQALKAIP